MDILQKKNCFSLERLLSVHSMIQIHIVSIRFLKKMYTLQIIYLPPLVQIRYIILIGKWNKSPVTQTILANTHHWKLAVGAMGTQYNAGMPSEQSRYYFEPNVILLNFNLIFLYLYTCKRMILRILASTICEDRKNEKSYNL